MSQIIEGVYELQNKIGEGGGGIVYRGWHLRLKKDIVLKADKRKLCTKPEALRREVDMLKGLRHTYIPQVYDFVPKDGIVYTVMDFIEGESLDNLLKRKQMPSQPQVIRWACQLLEALSYLHSRPPHGILHGDIKPQNIMLRPGGDICLIDYNIALALGEDGAVKGLSSGYASPEHYGSDYSGIFPERSRFSRWTDTEGSLETETSPDLTDRMETETSTAPMDTMETETKTMATGELASAHAGSSGTNGHRTVMLDARSDIYSLGATLYHLLSGRRPPKEALRVRPLGPEICSPAVSAIIQKAMSPNPKLRYQSAEEMRAAFLRLPVDDARAVRRRRQICFWAAMLTAVFFSGGICSFVGLKQMEQHQNALALSEYSADALERGNVPKALELAMQAVPEGKSILNAPLAAQAQKALTDALGVYDLSDGFKAFDTVELSSAPFGIALSLDGSRFAAVCEGTVTVFDAESRREIVSLPTQNSALSDIEFVDSSQIIYAGDRGVTAYDLDKKEVRWTAEEATELSLSGDKTVAAAVNRDEDCAAIYRVSDGEKLSECSFQGRHLPVAVNDIFADPESSVFALDEDGSLLAASFSDGGLMIFNLKAPNESILVYEKSDYIRFQGGFCGKYFAFAANKSDESEFGIIDTETAELVGGYSSRDNFLLHADERGICLASGNLLVDVDPETQKETELAYTNNAGITNFSAGEEYILAATDNPGFSFYDSGAHQLSEETCGENCDFAALSGKYAVLGNRNEPSLRILKLENHEESQLLSYDAHIEHDEARISQDGRTAMLFNYQKFSIFTMDGHLHAQVDLPEPEQIYDQQFRKSQDGSWLEVTWYDGTVRNYSAADGSVLSEKTGEPPRKDLYEEFYTDSYKITSALHEAPKVYDLESGRYLTSLQEEDYLAYVTQAGEYLITEYVSAAGERYGLLLNSSFQTLAYLPRLCDVSDGMLVFDYQSGDLRQCRFYSFQELMALGKESLKNKP